MRFEEGGGCHDFKRAQAKEFQSEIRITMVLEYSVPGEGEAYAEELKLRTVNVELKRRLV